MVAHLLVFGLVLALLAGPGPWGLYLGVGAAAAAASVWLRCRRAVSPPMSWLEPPVRRWVLLGVLAEVAIAVAAVAVFSGGFGAAGSMGLAWSLTLPSVTIAIIAARRSVTTAGWARDDWAAGASDLGVNAMLLAGVVTVLLLPLAMLTSLADVGGVVSASGLVRLVAVMIRLAAFCWWILQAIADARLLLSIAFCIWHRLQHDEIAERRFERESQWNDEIAGRFDDHADDDA